MSLSPLEIPRIRQETWIESIDFHREIPSTNDHALTLAADPLFSSPALVIAERQTAGRGRGGHTWQSGPGSLTFSLILDRPTSLPRERMPLVSLIAGLATRAAIASAAPGSPVQVKWPNDVYLAGRKAAGILTETASAAPDRLIVGIGINVNNSLADAPSEIRKRGISLIDYLEAPIDPTELLIRLLVELELELGQLAETGTLNVDRWRRHCLLTGREISIQAGSVSQAGLCRGVDANGALLIKTDQGVFPLYAGEVVRWSPLQVPSRETNLIDSSRSAL